MTQGMTAIGNPRTLTALLLHIRALGDLVKNPLIEIRTALPPPHPRTPHRPRIHRIRRRTHHRRPPNHRLRPPPRPPPPPPPPRPPAPTAESPPPPGRPAGRPLPRTNPPEPATPQTRRRARARGD